MPIFDQVKLEMGVLFPNPAQDPWPKDVQLFQPYETEQILLPDNANCLAVQAYLKMCKLDYSITTRSNAEAMSPTGKVPFIKCGAFVVSELEGIVQFVQSKGLSVSNDLDKEQKADMRAYMSLIRNVIENAENYVCWLDEETYKQVTKPRVGAVYPFPLNYFQTWDKRSNEIHKLKLVGWKSKSLEDVYTDVENCCQALSDRLGDNQFFFGKQSEVDCLVYAHLFAILTNPLPAGDNELAFVVSKFDKLMKFVRNIDKKVMGQSTQFDIKRYKEQQPSEAPPPADSPSAEVDESQPAASEKEPGEEGETAAETPANETPVEEKPAEDAPDEEAPAEAETKEKEAEEATAGSEATEEAPAGSEATEEPQAEKTPTEKAPEEN